MEIGNRDKVNALLISATTNPGQASLEHARAMIEDTFGNRKRILLINYASLPEARDAYAKRMQREFAKIGPGYEVFSIHGLSRNASNEAVVSAEGFFVSGGNTFLLLRELCDRSLVHLLQKRAVSGVPYIGSSAGSNIGGLAVGTTNDFPLVDIPTRQSLGLLPAIYNPHHPDPVLDEEGFAARQGKISQYVAYNKDEAVVGVTNPGMLRIRGTEISLAGIGAKAIVTRNGRSKLEESLEPGRISKELSIGTVT